MNRDEGALMLPDGVVRLLKALVAIGGVTFFAGLFLAPRRIWPDLLMASYFLLELSLAGIFFVALHYVTGASWNVALRRIPEAMAVVLPVGAAGMAAVLLLHPGLYPWFGVTSLGGDPANAGFKSLWLNRPCFLARSAVYIASWFAFATAIVRTSRRQDLNGDLSLTRRNARLSAGFLVVFGVTLCLASFDWIMSLEPRWSSTIFGIYDFASLFLGGLAALVILVVLVGRLAPTQFLVTEAHMHDLGKLLFAFSTFWAYIWFCQYMLIWYANIPEETAYFVERQHGFWGPLFLLNLLLNWGVPFLALMPVRAKKSANVLLKVALVILLGRWLDLYLRIVPPFAGSKPVLGVWEISLTAGAVGLFVLLFFQALQKAPLVPLKDPYLAESLHNS
jgi:hypothetical protein